MGLLKIKDCDPLDYVCTVNESSKLTEINVKAEYVDVFQGLGRLKDSYQMQIDDSIRPVVHAPRRVPVPIRNKIHEKLEQLVNEGVITPVTDATGWVSSMVVLQKPNGQIRLCLDLKDLTVAIRREYYTMPTIEEVSTRLKKSKILHCVGCKERFMANSIGWPIQHADVFQHAFRSLPFALFTNFPEWGSHCIVTALAANNNCLIKLDRVSCTNYFMSIHNFRCSVQLIKIAKPDQKRMFEKQCAQDAGAEINSVRA